jgi:uncharacterized protein (TIGR03067 family)
MVPIAVSFALIFAAGCSTPKRSNSDAPPPTSQTTVAPRTESPDATELEGVWKGVEITKDNEGPASLTFSGQTLDYHGHEDGDWLKGTFTLREDTTPRQFIGVITACDNPDAIGKKCYAIYKIEDGALTVSGAAPGESDFPSAFDATGAREFVFKRTP